MQQQPTPPAPPQRKWTEEQRQQVKAMLEKGASASMVAKAMQIGRNQALGRIWRDPEMKLQGYGKHSKKSGVSKYTHNAAAASYFSPSKPKPVAAKVPVSPQGDFVHICKPTPPPLPVINTVAHPMALIGTGRRWCKWPIETAPDVLGGFLCCGATTLPQDVYCAKHRKLSKAEVRRW